MGIIRVLRFLLSVYAMMQLVHFALPYVGGSQRPWMMTLSRLCEPGVQMGNRVASRLLPDKRFNINVGPLAAAAVCYIVRMILGIFF
ncbi:MAG: YggT family protein [Clostridia bacterium]|nr:YggT family protein [Clostridia bacterium]